MLLNFDDVSAGLSESEFSPFGASRQPSCDSERLIQAVKEFYSKFNESLAAPAALLVTTVNTKHIGDASTRTRGGITSPAVTAILRLTYCVGAEISAYDYDEKGTFVLLGNAGPELIGRQAS
ncbi:hypothetical protein F2Q69_00040259 [Brassica cretica]|uniref:Uncharacterized protein n=1 Tax=Brassica cretica TaxID=69181 RepID=A0A8S9N858_BRACR|nr:hypothetical protein F2Q69_00040259 [Brassica cretica]